MRNKFRKTLQAADIRKIWRTTVYNVVCLWKEDSCKKWQGCQMQFTVTAVWCCVGLWWLCRLVLRRSDHWRGTNSSTYFWLYRHHSEEGLVFEHYWLSARHLLQLMAYCIHIAMWHIIGELSHYILACVNSGQWILSSHNVAGCTRPQMLEVSGRDIYAPWGLRLMVVCEPVLAYRQYLSLFGLCGVEL